MASQRVGLATDVGQAFGQPFGEKFGQGKMDVGREDKGSGQKEDGPGDVSQAMHIHIFPDITGNYIVAGNVFWL